MSDTGLEFNPSNLNYISLSLTQRRFFFELPRDDMEKNGKKSLFQLFPSNTILLRRIKQNFLRSKKKIREIAHR